MKANEVLKLLRITRPTLTKYVKEGLIKVEKLPNGRYEYDSESVYSFLNKDMKRKTYIYARVSTSKQKPDLNNNFEKRNDFFKMLDDIIDNKVERVVITYKDRLSRIGFDLFYHLFQKYNCEIVIMSEVGSEKLDRQEIFEEIESLLHCYSMKFYSKRKIQKVKEVLTNENND